MFGKKYKQIVMRCLYDDVYIAVRERIRIPVEIWLLTCYYGFPWKTDKRKTRRGGKGKEKEGKGKAKRNETKRGSVLAYSGADTAQRVNA